DQKRVAIGAQNIHHELAGAYTGEVSAGQVKSTGAEYVIIGHSERRIHFHEDSYVLSKKVEIALEKGLKAIYCVGETEDQRREAAHFRVITQQLEDGLAPVSPSHLPRIVLAYEPVWAIGTGLTASPEQAQEMHARIRETVARLFDG